MKHLIEIVGMLEDKRIGFTSLTEAIDTTTPGGKLIFHIFSSLAEFERNVIRERTQAGLVAARARGREGGRPAALSAEDKETAVKMYHAEYHTAAVICSLMGISRTTLYKYVREAAADD